MTEGEKVAQYIALHHCMGEPCTCDEVGGEFCLARGLYSDVKKALATARREALEEAASHCDERASNWRGMENTTYAAYAELLELTGRQIRALLDTQEAG